MNRDSKLKELIQKSGMSYSDIAKNIFGDSEEEIKKGVQKIELLLDYRDTSSEDVKLWQKIVDILPNATEDDKKYIIAQVMMYKTVHKSELDKKFSEHIAEMRRAEADAEAKYWAEVADPEVENLINGEITFEKAVEWMKAKEAEKAKKASKPKKEKKAKDATVVETADAPVESVEGIEENPFDTL